MPIVLFALVLMSAVAMTTLIMSGDEARSTQALRHSGLAFYAAEGGLNQTLSNWTTWQTQIDSLEGADSLDLGWQSLGNTASYRAVIHRWSNDDAPMYELKVDGKSATLTGAQRRLTYFLTEGPGSGGTGYMLGECCAAAAVLKGSYGQKPRDGGTITHSGFDEHPPGWEDADVCADTLIDKPGLIMADTMLADLDPPDAQLVGNPPLMEDTGITEVVFDNFGDLTWSEIKDMANIVVDGPNETVTSDDGVSVSMGSSPQIQLDEDDVYPRYNADGTCDTTHPLNMGSDDPNDPCFNYFPIILMKGEIEFGSKNGGRFYAQGLIVLDFDEVAGTGAEMEFEVDANFRGITLGKGCVEIQKGTQYYGSVFVDATYDGATCDKSNDLHTDCYALQGCTNTKIQWSQCAVDRTLVNSGLADYAEPTIPGDPGPPLLLDSRSFNESFF